MVPPPPEPANLVDRSSAAATSTASMAFARPELQGQSAAIATCPSDRTVLAPKGQDYVLMAKITSRDGSPLDVIAGPQAGDPVSEGPHPVVGRLVPPLPPSSSSQSPRRPPASQSPLCRLTYTVVVRHCGPPPLLSTPPGTPPRGPRCTAGTAWGSRCHYRCPRRDLVLRGNSWLQCGDDLRWDGRPPVCTGRPNAWPAAVATPPSSTPTPRRSCPVLVSEHGVVSCRARDDANDDDDNDALRLAEGSECTVACKPPHRLQLAGLHHDEKAVSAVTRCSAGRWNVTSWRCVRGETLDGDVDGDIPAVLSDAGSDQDWDARDNSVTDPCSPNPCLSGGVCLRGPPRAKALCQCRPGTEGERCERVLCRGTCLHGGRCVLLAGRHSCFCRRGYAGSRCQAPVKDVRYPAAATASPRTPATTATASNSSTPATPSSGT